MEDLTHVNWEKGINKSGTPGCYFKACIENKYYKLSSFDTVHGFFGHEAFNEVIVSRLGNILGINTLVQVLKEVQVNVRGQRYTTYACKSDNYISREEKRSTFENFYITYRKQGEDIYKFIARCGLNNWFNIMFVLDYIIVNRDRHGANIEVLVKPDRSLRLAPYFDNGLSFVCTITKDLPDYKDRVRNTNPFQDTPVNNYVGTRSLQSNLDLITEPVRLHKLKKEHKRNIFYGMHKELGDIYIEKIWQIITYRYMFLKKRGIVIDD